MPLTIAQALRDSTARLARSPSPSSDADELLSRCLELTRSQLQLDRDRELDAAHAARFESWVSRRALGEPVQYITGRAAFRSLDLFVDSRVLIPRPETEGLVEVVLDALRTRKEWPAPRVCDLGCGSGAIALAIAHECERCVITATDMSTDALDVSLMNAAALGLDARVRLIRSDWFEALEDERFEVIVSNPPYIATGEWDALPEDVRSFEPQIALFSGSSGLDALREIIDQAPRHLVAGGLLALELAEARAAEVAGWLDGAHDWSGVELRDDLAGRPRVLIATKERGPAIAPLQWPEEDAPR